MENIDSISTPARGTDPFSVVVVGAGVHGVHLALAVSRTYALDRKRIALVDPFHEPLTLWRRRVENCGMDYLRSNGSHTLAPSFYALRSEMGPKDHTAPYHRPSVDLFQRQARRMIHEIQQHTVAVHGTVTDITVPAEGSPERPRHALHRGYVVHCRCTDGRERELHAAAVILAPGNGAPEVPPGYREPLPPGIMHIHDPRMPHGALPQYRQPGDRVLIAGSGIAACHLALTLVNHGIHVEVWHRDPLEVHQFDSDPCFIGPRCAALFESIADPEIRHQLIDRSRRSGSIPEDLYTRFMAAVHHNRIVLHRREMKSWLHAPPGIVATPGNREFDQIILSTGFSREPPAAPLVSALASRYAAPVSSRGFPVPSGDLQWLPGLFVTGALADLVHGPPARNIIGAHLSRRKILPAIRKYLDLP